MKHINTRHNTNIKMKANAHIKKKCRYNKKSENNI